MSTPQKPPLPKTEEEFYNLLRGQTTEHLLAAKQYGQDRLQKLVDCGFHYNGSVYSPPLETEYERLFRQAVEKILAERDYYV